MARPTKLSKEIEEKIVLTLKSGLPKTLACEVAGISRQTLQNWLNDKRNKSFADSVTKASAQGKMNLFVELRKLAADPRTSADTRARALQWMLERVDRENFGYKATLEIEKPPEEGITPQKAGELMRGEFGSVGPDGSSETEAAPGPGQPLH